MDKDQKSNNKFINKKDNINFQYVLTVVLNHEQTGKKAERITKVKPFINKYKLEGRKFVSEKDDYKKTEKNNITIALNVSYAKKEKNISCLHFKK